MKSLSLLLLLGLSVSVFAQKPSAEEPAEANMTPEQAKAAFFDHVEKFGWTRKGEGKLGSTAKIAIPQGYRFTGSSGAKKLMEVYGNIPGEQEVGLIAPEDLNWCVLFEYEGSGYVSDKDKDELNADEIMESLQEGQEMANEARKEQGLDTLSIKGWATPPKYNSTTNNLEWGLNLASSDGGENVNYLTRLLGRGGVMSVTLICSPEELKTILPDYQKLIAGFAYLPGQTYGEYVKGDKLADYTLAGLITAGAGFAAVKSGLLGKLGVLFAKLGKAAILVVVAIAAAAKKLFSKLFGKSDPSA